MEGDEPSHKAMLYFLEILMNSDNALTISQLAGRFGSRSFSAEMRQAAGGNEAGLRRFLLKYPALFSVNGNMVSANTELGSLGGGGGSGGGSSEPAPRDAEKEAIQYFAQKMMRKEDTWIPIKSLAGHLSQAPLDIRNVVGPQSEFKKFLTAHSDVFDVHEEIVSLKDNTAPRTSRRSNYKPVQNGFSSDLSDRPRGRGRGMASRSSEKSDYTKSLDSTPVVGTQATSPKSSTKKSPVTMTANEYKALNYVKSIVEKKGSVKIHNITGHFSQAPETVRNTIGWTKYELEEFIKKYPQVFQVSEDGEVTVIKNARLNVVITGSRPHTQAVQALNGRKGKIYHVAKLWGIIDLGKHEHVFFDRSIYHLPCTDFQGEFTVGEYLNFNAVLAPKVSRAKWRATAIWKEGELPPYAQGDNVPNKTEDLSSSQDHEKYMAEVFKHSESIEEEISKLLPTADIDFGSSSDEGSPTFELTGDKNYAYNDAAPSMAGVIPVWNFNPGSDKQKKKDNLEAESDKGFVPIPTVSMVPESQFMYTSTVSDARLTAGYIAIPDPQDMPTQNGANHADGEKDNNKENNDDASGKKTREIGCQTIATGDILATQLYHAF
ncbi:uncharacterized protein LOC106175412 [Lingula anatina]|uniref:Uncharacterized protein LOC106175412 n=1 Tax=Lingula anatina TaxID=7574 RepID=A0A1S3JR86_LINAN|nr:uncharacterized protein LOC106175412 [Lingula anatina]XP_013412852.1 uncharacterized protein LOC106175412 [Lingula anatina]|eukprot:XP_013412851.1 uncharacterized protein LOC106175412 [Lingula anatina]